MNKDEVLKYLSEHKELLKDLGVKSIALFGSVARGEEDTDSDLDILVEFHGKATFDKYMELKFFLEDRLNRNVDLVTEKGLRPHVRPKVEKDAIYVP